MKNLLWSILILMSLVGVANAQNVSYGYPYQYGIVSYPYPVYYSQPVVVQPVPYVVYYPAPVVTPVVAPLYYQQIVTEKYVPCWRRPWNYSPQQYVYIRY